MRFEDLTTWLKKCEGYSSHIYTDTTGHKTIGFGRNLDNGIRLNEAELMLENDINHVIEELKNFVWYNEQPEDVQCALINMAFNLGIAGLVEFTKMIDALIRKDYPRAALEALNSKWAHQVGSRAKDIALIFRGHDAATTRADSTN